MINYVNNAYDKVLKPCDAQRFSIIINSQETEKHILCHRGGDAKAKSKLPALTYMGVLDSEKYRKYLDQCKKQGTKPLGSRRAEFMRPTGLLMLDFDHVGRSPLRDGVILNEMKDPSESQAKSQREIPLCARDDRSAIDSPVKLWEYIVGSYDNVDLPLAEWVALAHVTPSGDGLRVVVKRTVGATIEQEQYEWCKAMKLDKVGIMPDAVCKDISRLSFAPMLKEILYFNPSLLFGELPDAADYPDGTIFSGVAFRDGVIPSNARDLSESPGEKGLLGETKVSFVVNAERSASPRTDAHSASAQREILRVAQNDMQDGASYDTEYRGVPYSEIVSRLEEQLGGRPEHGARNSFIFTMACNLRYICNDDAAWIASILPTYGEEPQKHRTTIQSAVNRPMSREMPETLKRALGVAKACADNGQQTTDNSLMEAPALPEVLPQPVSLLVERIPERMRAAAAMAVFPALGAYVKDMHLVYADGRDYEPTFMNILVAEQSAGKSAVNKPIDHILAPLKARDEVSLSREREWKEKCAIISSTQDKPERPKGLCVQILPPDMTNAAFVQRLSDADGHFLYTRMDEVELLNALRTNGTANMVSAVLRLAFDCGEYGQVRVAANAVNAMVRVRWNWNASSTVQRVRKYFAKNIADGTLSRLSFATIPESEEDVYSEEFPVYEHYAENYADQLQPYIDRIETCTGTLVCPEAVAWVRAINKELLTFAREAEDSGYARMSRRGILMGFFRAMLLYVMNGCQWSEEIERFATWSVKYDLWCKMRFFRDMLRSDIEGERAALQRGPVGLLPLLPQEFTRDDVRALRIAQGMKPDPTALINKWVTRKQVLRDAERGVYVKQ